ncbi:LRR receptor-like serine/threonine-protein kinase ERECTA [Zingiber officinale]|uniref:LRR receptor-like serine/threonine-protein kinase ERECTA n=1 Tax=Zingiber officinale TaxID=94328 RepID=UPI001C4B64D3|nr:LRR receptor-like serine/threonine-protein kinase ERECTA [Zingiber officinale]
MEVIGCCCLRDCRFFMIAVVSVMVMVSLSGVTAILDPIDFLALQAIRKSLDDMPGSEFFSAWDFTGDPCDFPGVFCVRDHVVALALGDPRAGAPGLNGRLDPALGRLSALAELSLVPGRVTGPIPDALSSCSELRFLVLSNNLLSGPVPTSLAGLPHLRTLDLGYNQLTGSIPASIASSPKLSNLILCHNQLSGSLPPFPTSSPLLHLNLKHNQLSGPVPPLPPSLQYLSLGSNALNGRVDTVLRRLIRLNFLDLSSNFLYGSIPGVVFGFPLAALHLQRNAFSGPVEPSQDDVVIPVVDLSYNRLWGAVPPQLASVSRLYLNNNRFTGDVPNRLVQGLNNGMQLLYLQHNFLTGIEIGTATAALPAGTALCLHYNCMVPPIDTPCPLKAGSQRMRPLDQCPDLRV